MAANEINLFCPKAHITIQFDWPVRAESNACVCAYVEIRV